MISKFLSECILVIERLLSSSKPKKPVTKPNPYNQYEVWLIQGTTVYKSVVRNSVDNYCLFIRVKFRGEWYKCNNQGFPIGEPQCSDNWVAVTRIS